MDLKNNFSHHLPFLKVKISNPVFFCFSSYNSPRCLSKHYLRDHVLIPQSITSSKTHSTTMLSYMLPVEEKPPPGPGGTKSTHSQMQLALDASLANCRTSTPISKETSVSSFASDATTATASHSSMTPTSTSDKGKPKLAINGKHPTLKR